MISPADLRRFAPDCDADTFAPILTAQFAAGYIDTALRADHFLAQTAEETGGYTVFVENLNYSATGLVSIWPSHFSTADALSYARQPERIANRAYANRMGNGDEASGDGWKYRGRGLMQLTGRANYAAMATLTGLDLINHPELLEQPKPAVVSAIAFWTQHDLNAIADYDDITTITRVVNGGLINLAARQNWLAKAKTIWGTSSIVPAPLAAQPVMVSTSLASASAPTPSPVTSIPPAGATVIPAVAPNPPQVPVTDTPDAPIQLPNQVVAQVTQLGTHWTMYLLGGLGSLGVTLLPGDEAKFAAVGGSVAVALATIGVNAALQFYRYEQAKAALATAKAS